MKAILIAAGMGRRLSPYTDDRPKCLVEIAGRTMLHRQLDNLRAVGVTEFHIVRGYRGHQLSEALAGEPNVHFIENPDYQRNNILLSLMYAADRMDGGFFCSYSDIVYRPEVAAALAQSPTSWGWWWTHSGPMPTPDAMRIPSVKPSWPQCGPTVKLQVG
jgi:choline kinase